VTITYTPITPLMTKSFGATSLPVGGETSLGFTIINPNATTALSGIGFTDPLPSGLAVATPNGLTGSCGGGTITAVAGSNSISLSGATLAAASSCTFSVNVVATGGGTQDNTTSDVTSNLGNGNGATATLTVVAPPSIAKSFSPTSILLNGTSTLTFTITNPAANTVAQTGVAFTDTLPSGLVVASPDGLTNTCGGTASINGGTISLSGGSIAVDSSCAVALNVTGATPGTFTNISGPVSSTNGGTGNQANASLTVISPAIITKSFGTPAIPFGGQTSLSFTVSNPNTTTPLSGVGFSDALPSGLVVATPSSGLTGSCGGGTISAVAGSNSISLSGATLAAASSCTFSVNVIGISPGTTLTNTTSAITSNEASPGTPATASLTVQSCPSGDNTYLLTATTSIGTIYGGVCISPVNVKATKQALYVGTYQQGPVSGQALLSVDPTTGTTTLTGQGFNLNMTATTAPGVNSFVESQPFSASGTFTLTTLP
jgi:uncharacterized repeat protein (TIGR01451 family)